VARPFLTAQWLDLVMLNFEVEPQLLRPYVPVGTELDYWEDKALVSVVGLRFQDTRLLGCPIPFHRHFDEVNLRFYVGREHGGEWRRGVVFIREVVAKPAVTAVARLTYNEAYVTHPMRHDIQLEAAKSGAVGRVTYKWRGTRWNEVTAETCGGPEPIVPGSEAEFVSEHYWGYARQRGGGTLEYEVRHPKWRVWRTTSARLDCDIAAMYGEPFRGALEAEPVSAFVAEGSPVEVYPGVRL
jgi:hypothetical protein